MKACGVTRYTTQCLTHLIKPQALPDEAYDKGTILWQKEYPLAIHETVDSLRIKAQHAEIQGFIEVTQKFENGILKLQLFFKHSFLFRLIPYSLLRCKTMLYLIDNLG